MNEVNQRLIQVMDKYGYRKSEWAEMLDVSPAIISHIYNGRNKAGVDLIQKLILKFPEINERWLLLGEGEMIKVNTAKTTLIIAEKVNQLSTRVNLHKNQFKEIIHVLEDLVKIVNE